MISVQSPQNVIFTVLNFLYLYITAKECFGLPKARTHCIFFRKKMGFRLEDTIHMTQKERIRLIFQCFLKEKATKNTNTNLQAQMRHIIFYPDQYSTSLQTIAKEASLIENYILEKM